MTNKQNGKPMSFRGKHMQEIDVQVKSKLFKIINCA